MKRLTTYSFFFQTGYCQTGNECTGDVGNAEADLGNKGQQQAENKCHDVVTAEVLVAGFPPLFKEEVVQYSGTDRHNEERQNVDDNSEYTVVDQQCAQCLFAAAVAGLLAAQTDNNSQSDNAQNVIDYGSTQNGIAGTGVQGTQFLQSFYGDADGSCSQDNADENVLPEQGSHFRILFRIVEVGEEKSAYQRNNDAQQGNDKGGKSCLFQFLNVGFQSGTEHEDDNAQFCQTDDQVIPFYNVQQHRAENDASCQCTNDLRQADPLGQQPQQLGGQQNDRDLQ